MSAPDLTQLSRPTARSIIESLASGVVPREGAQFFTAGRERWLKSLQEDLEDLGDPTCVEGRLRVFLGRNGDGKTHLMHLLRRLAFDQGFAVSYVIVSSDVPLYRSDRVYASIGQSLTTATSGSRSGLRAIFDAESPDQAIAFDFNQRAEAIRRIAGIDPRFANALYRYCTRQTVNIDQEQDLLLLGAWLEGNPGKLSGMGVTGQVDLTNGTSMLQSLVLVLRHFGLKGLVVLVDEVESVLGMNANNRRDSYQTLRLLIDRENLPGHALTVASMTPPMFSDAEKGIQTYPALWSRLRPEGNAGFINYFGTLVDLTRTPLSARDFFHVGIRIRELHAYARSWDPSSKVTDGFVQSAADIASEGRLTLVYSATRVFVKLITETLELAYQHEGFSDTAINVVERFGEVDDELTADEGVSVS